MAAADILRIAVTVGVVQAVCDLMMHWWVFSRESYLRSIEKMERAEYKVHQLKEKASEKNAKRLIKAEEEKSIMAAVVARHHMLPGLSVSFLFLLLMRILGTELKGKIVGVIPFVPYGWFRRLLIARGLEFPAHVEFMADPGSKVDSIAQACSFTFIYMLSTMSVKYYVNQLLGTQPPLGAESVTTLYETPQGKKMVKSWTGIDMDELKKQS
jgi:Integral membrane protein EMC3/TMCO1-like